eukprot:TRINITY_DN1017_c0_g2_i3.p2 TRINITY_DN1017_c0_g2~~TRINITY_DN1017_c0_g2_i3.p2  ORF type:complete len:105 (-),score=11.80 TRINITY_DN1017_c0_g2_i3:324-638(-)
MHFFVMFFESPPRFLSAVIGPVPENPRSMLVTQGSTVSTHLRNVSSSSRPSCESFTHLLLLLLLLLRCRLLLRLLLRYTPLRRGLLPLLCHRFDRFDAGRHQGG